MPFFSSSSDFMRYEHSWDVQWLWWLLLALLIIKNKKQLKKKLCLTAVFTDSLYYEHFSDVQWLLRLMLVLLLMHYVSTKSGHVITETVIFWSPENSPAQMKRILLSIIVEPASVSKQKLHTNEIEGKIIFRFSSHWECRVKHIIYFTISFGMCQYIQSFHAEFCFESCLSQCTTSVCMSTSNTVCHGITSCDVITCYGTTSCVMASHQIVWHNVCHGIASGVLAWHMSWYTSWHNLWHGTRCYGVPCVMTTVLWHESCHNARWHDMCHGTIEVLCTTSGIIAKHASWSATGHNCRSALSQILTTRRSGQPEKQAVFAPNTLLALNSPLNQALLMSAMVHCHYYPKCIHGVLLALNSPLN